MSAPQRRDAVALLSGQPLAITEAGLRLVVAVVSRDEFFPATRQEALNAREGRPLSNTRKVTMRNGGVAVIEIAGPLFRYASAFEDVSAVTSYAGIRKDFQTAMESPEVRAVVFDVNSPGGEVTGCDELAAAVRAGRGTKPIVAYVGGDGCSAAYWLASAADEIICAASATLGSIGVRTALIDDTKQQELQGRRRIEFVSSQSPNKSIDPANAEDRARLQRQLDDLAAVFIDTVARNRGVSAATVADDFGKGGVFVGASAVRAGLADRLGSLESVIAEFGADREARAAGGAAVAAGSTTARVRKPLALRQKPPAPSADDELGAAIALAAAQARVSVGIATQTDRELCARHREGMVAKRSAARAHSADAPSLPKETEDPIAAAAAAAHRELARIDRTVARHAAAKEKENKR